MCAVSVLHDYMRERIPRAFWNRSLFDDFKTVLKQVDNLDKKLQQPDCHDPEKAVWMEEIESRLAELEQ